MSVTLHVPLTFDKKLFIHLIISAGNRMKSLSYRKDMVSMLDITKCLIDMIRVSYKWKSGVIQLENSWRLLTLT